MAKSSSLNVRVVEGRALPAKDVSGSSDPYCLVKVDDEVVARTATVWRSLSPFWGEEYTIHLPMDFHHLAFYVLDEDTVGHDDVIGKISLSRDTIAADPRGIDSWINLSRVDPDAEVQGEVCLDVQMLENARGRCLRCHVLQARDLAPRDITGTSDPFARVFWGSQSLETSTIKKTRFPHWDEVLELQEMPGAPAPLRVELWDWDMVGKNDFLGMVEFPPPVLQQNPPRGWFRLLPFPRAEEDSGEQLGALRLKVRLIEDRILPSHNYRPLTELLTEAVRGPAEEDAASPLAVLEELTSGDCRQDLATNLVKLFLGQGLAGPFLDYLTRREVTRTTDPNTLFRSNSLASKSMEQFMKLVGMPYLHEVLKPVINRVFEEKRYIELDPCKIDLGRTRRISFKGAPSEEHVREASLGLLTGYLGPIVDAIVGSVGRCPPAMRLAFKQLHQRVQKRFPQAEHEDAKYLAISGFLFLRFFAPAILTPKLFDLRDQHADPQTSRSLLLLAKAVQSIGNLGQQLGQGKELWMAPLHPFLLQSISRVRDFLDQLVDVDGEDALLHPGVAHPRRGARGRGRLSAAARDAGDGAGRRRGTADHLPPVQECERAQPVAVGPAQGQRPQPGQAGRLPPGCLPQLALDLLPAGRALRMKFQEDFNIDTSPEADTMRASGAKEGACPEALARQREAAGRLLEVLADLDRAHEELQQREQQKAALGPLGH
ncbi:rasGAP-activating-like protein 1 isoform X3 [Prionailurus viverrinus]|uniref:rasGAP-activating-like protein 1 isoform X3 n=1 Tax=Prionailurus viverrinus TaxID=61388 RepID=UPI001FF4FCF1|nr:rasGAP-activating-like protein 1 isoform X3 [Prionailurus viverrinus]